MRSTTIDVDSGSVEPTNPEIPHILLNLNAAHEDLASPETLTALQNSVEVLPCVRDCNLLGCIDIGLL
jgi:hypothetical protein